MGPGYFEANLIDNTGQPHLVVTSYVPPVINQWWYIAVTYDKTSGEAALYVNGSAVTRTNVGTFTPRTTGNLYLGTRSFGDYQQSSLRFRGLMDEVTVYRRALTPAELRCSYINGDAAKYPPPADCVQPAEGIISWWRFESNLLDSVTGIDSYPMGAISTTNGRVGRAIQPIRATLHLSGSEDLAAEAGLTVEGWLNPIRLTFLFAQMQTGFSLQWNGSLRAALSNKEGKIHNIDAPSGLLQTGTWHHVALTYDRSSGWGSLYMNGMPVASTNLGSFTPDVAGPLFLGNPAAGLPWRLFDEFAIYDRALSSFEIHSIYTSQNGRCTEPPMIRKHPESMRVNAGSDVTFEVEATGNPLLRYQWFKDGRAMYNRDQTPRTGTLLELTSVTESAQGSYHVMVTNTFGYAVSSNAVLLVNYPPVAVASAARPLIVLPPCTNEVVAALDGSQSSDPDGDLLDYQWCIPGTTDTVATGVVAVVHLAAGIGEFELVVNDGLLKDTNRVIVEVLTSEQALQRLTTTIVESVWSRKQPLLSSLNAARNSVSKNHLIPAINELQAVEHKVRVQVDPEEPELAAELRGHSRAIIAALLSCGPNSGPGHGTVKAEHHNGRVKMEFQGADGGVFIVEALFDMNHWRRIGVARETDSGRFDFEDPNAWRYSCRFYRIVTP